jgi:hypothetical protein
MKQGDPNLMKAQLHILMCAFSCILSSRKFEEKQQSVSEFRIQNNQKRSHLHPHHCQLSPTKRIKNSRIKEKKRKEKKPHPSLQQADQ